MVIKCKKILSFPFVLVALCASLLSYEASAQKFGYYNSDFVLSKMPDYQKAQEQIDQLATEWQGEIQAKQLEIDEMYSELKAEEVLLTEEMRKERLETIHQMESKLKEYTQKVFGFEGLLYLKKQEVIKPVLDQVFEAVEKVANQHKLQIVFDKSGDMVMTYTDPIHDYTDYILDELGLGDKEDVIR
ncbi:OmpH family outer membrane protein [Catalinimonas niigatensis]|uniref:OmpH family outer membrane protein n=1 Tax=Catalinimonas niigatensis TaxID=1397264 RepID=UPI002665A7D8|nr:OmpH family outer membrane protein [Catalinimonas niigatensis]WPP53476.1 OmpH family outer membrane protein [Catalinimonas niigatensis]